VPALVLADLDQRPELRPVTASLFAACPPGHNHQVCGLPQRMGLEPHVEDFDDCLGVIIVLSGIRLVGALALCPYSTQQVTLWGPVVPEIGNVKPVSARLIKEARNALRGASYESMRCLVDTRNRAMRALLQGNGFSAWKDNHLYQRDLTLKAPTGSSAVRPAVKADFSKVARVLSEAFPDSDHCQPGLAKRERDGFRHYLLEEDGTVVVAAAIDGQHRANAPARERRSWLKLIAVQRASRGQHLSRKLLDGIIAAETKLQVPAIALEVLADNLPAIALYEHSGFERQWTAAIMTAPV
jgi:ribosomal protein S18 acetylase RimI-like enzyme